MTEIPADIEEMNATTEYLEEVYLDLLGTNGVVNTAIKGMTTSNVQGLHSASIAPVCSGWLKLTETGKVSWPLCIDPETDDQHGTLPNRTIEFIRKSAQAVRTVEDIRLALEAELDEKYNRTLRDVVKVLKEGKTLYDKVKQRRLELDSKKYRLQNSNTNDAEKLKHYQSSVQNVSEKFEYDCGEYRRVMMAFFSTDDFVKLQEGIVSCYIKAMLDYHRRSVEKLAELERQLDLNAASSFNRNYMIENRKAAAPVPAASTAPLNGNGKVGGSGGGMNRSESQNSLSNSVENLQLEDNRPPPAYASNGAPPPVNTAKKPAVVPGGRAVFPMATAGNVPVTAAAAPAIASYSQNGQAPMAVPPLPPKVRTVRVVALFPFQAVESADLSFAKDEVIEVIKQEGDWWEGRVEGNPARRGVFPSNYVRLL